MDAHKEFIVTNDKTFSSFPKIVWIIGCCLKDTDAFIPQLQQNWNAYNYTVTFVIDTSLIPNQFKTITQTSSDGIGLGFPSGRRTTGSTPHYFAQRIRR